MAQEEIFTIDQGSDVAIEMFIVQKDGNARNIASHAFNMKMKRSFSSTDSADIINWATIVSDADKGIMTASLTNTQEPWCPPWKYNNLSRIILVSNNLPLYKSWSIVGYGIIIFFFLVQIGYSSINDWEYSTLKNIGRYNCII